MATRLKPSRINVDNTPHVGEGAAYKNDDDFHWSMGGGDMSYRDFEWNTLTGNSITIEDISNNITPSSDFTVSAGTELKPGIEYVLRVNTGSTPYTMTLGTGVTNPNLYKTELKPNTVNQFKFIATSTSQLELEGVDSAVVSEINWGEIDGTLSNQTDLQNALNSKADKEDVNIKVFHIASTNDITNAQAAIDWWEQGRLTGGYTPIIEFGGGKELYGLLAVYDGFQAVFTALAPETTQGTSKTTTSIKEIAFSLTGTPGQPQTVTAISTSNYLDINYLDTSASYSSPYTPSTPGSPTTKKYVDDHDTIVSATAPSSPAEGILWYDTTNDVLKAYDGTSWNEVGSDAADINTKTFYISNTSDTANAQAAIDWYLSGKNPLIIYQDQTYIYSGQIALEGTDKGYQFTRDGGVVGGAGDSSGVTPSGIQSSTLDITTNSSDIVTQISFANKGFRILPTGSQYPVQYTPQEYRDPVNKKYVDDKVTTSATAPSSPTEGMLWYDTTNDQLKVYDGTNWNITGKEYNAGEGISIEDVSINGRKGPSPDGFHVPSATEWQGVNTIMTSLSLTTSDSWRINLHMPLVGFRVNTNASLYTQGSNGVYWSSSPSSWTSTYARSLNLSQYGLYVDSESDRASSVSVRSFKDSYVEPTSSWTVVQGTLGSAGIFWNQNEGLISVTNGTTGYTMMDKNLGATTVYNNGDTLTEANMGYMYQWGNNYGFPSTGTISNTSSTHVDASAYGPTNPYSSDTFITGGSDWSSVQNDDLWGDTTGIITQENVISNTGVLSVNGQTGDVTVNEPIVSANAPSDPTEGQLWYDTTNDVLKVYDGTDWVGQTYNIGTGLTLENYKGDITDAQGPCPEGYHVPLQSELQALRTALLTTFGLPAGTETPGTYLLMPAAGYRSNNTGDMVGSGFGYYRSSNASGKRAYCFYFYDTGVSPSISVTSWENADGGSIRPFKDTPVIPDNSWTVLYDGSSMATGASVYDPGIYYNSTLGLISISGDGESWITMTDKNLGATVVYSYGDELTDNNCGYQYQRGNNNPFPRSGTINKVYTQVSDVSSYGPGNYYSRNKYVVGYESWSKEANINLWGGNSRNTSIENTIKNTGVLSWNSQSGNVTVSEQNGIEIGKEIQSRGPCPEGFHLPSVHERQAIWSLGVAMGAWTTSSGVGVSTYLKMPYTGYRSPTTGQRTTAGANYWACESASGGSGVVAGRWSFNDTGNTGPSLTSNNYINTRYGLPIRAVKDSYSTTTPSTSWTTLFDGSSYASGAGIFWNQSLGLITLKDGTSGITISDKNLGATTVYNYGDELTDANCGCLFQRGNCYAFPRSGTVKTSTEQVTIVSGQYTRNKPFRSDIFRISTNANASWATPASYAMSMWGKITTSYCIRNSLPFEPLNGGDAGNILQKTSDGYEWVAPSGGDVGVSSQANNILTSGMKIWAGTQANYEALGSYDNNTVYLTI